MEIRVKNRDLRPNKLKGNIVPDSNAVASGCPPGRLSSASVCRLRSLQSSQSTESTLNCSKKAKSNKGKWKMAFKNVSTIFLYIFHAQTNKSYKNLHSSSPFCPPFYTQGNRLFCTLTVTPLSTRLSRSFGLLEDSVVFNFRLELMNFVQIKQRVFAAQWSMQHAAILCATLHNTPYSSLLCTSLLYSSLWPFSSFADDSIQELS